MTDRPTGRLDFNNTHNAGHHIRTVLVDGIEIGQVFACNPEEGWADAIVFGDDGLACVKDGEIEVRRLTGKISVIWV